jgi:hypothetical protein
MILTFLSMKLTKYAQIINKEEVSYNGLYHVIKQNRYVLYIAILINKNFINHIRTS